MAANFTVRSLHTKNLCANLVSDNCVLEMKQADSTEYGRNGGERHPCHHPAVRLQCCRRISLLEVFHVRGACRARLRSCEAAEFVGVCCLWLMLPALSFLTGSEFLTSQKCFWKCSVQECEILVVSHQCFREKQSKRENTTRPISPTSTEECAFSFF